MSDVRQAAVGVLLRLEGGHTTLAAELERAREGLGDRRDRGLLVEIATGTLRWQQELDALITAASRRPAMGIDPPARAVLRLGAYQLRHLDRIPVHAVVHESVETVRAVGAPRAAGFVNAVLRTLIRRGQSLKLPARPRPGDSEDCCLAFLSITLSHPEWLVRRWLARYGFEATERWCLFNNTAPDVAVRPIAPLSAATLLERLHEQGIGATAAPFVSDAIRLAPGALGRLSPDLQDALAVQDEGSQLVARFAGATPDERVLDVCAAPGGKTLILAGDLALGDPRHHSVLVAGDRRLARVRLLSATLGRSGLAIPVVALDALRPLPFGSPFDCVFLDAPCSGLGTLRRDPDLKWSRREDDLGRLVIDQLRMLKSAADLVRPGGRLIYATCSSEPEENIGVVRTFLHRDARFAVARPPESVRVPAEVVDSNGQLVTEPFRHGLDAYFAVRLVRREGTWSTFLDSMPARTPSPGQPPVTPTRIGTHMWSAGRLLLLAVALSVTFGAFFLTALRVTTRAREVKVPDIRGRTITEATAALTDAGLVLKVDLRRPDPKVPADRVLSQEPDPGTVLRRQRAVRVRVSDGQRDPLVPTVVGQAERTAEIVLAQAQIEIGDRAEIHAAGYPDGTVVAQDPGEKQRAAKVSLLVNRGQTGATFVMPDVIGTVGIRAVDLLRRRGFRVSASPEAPYPGLPPGVVVRQIPQAGFQIAAGDPIVLELSR